jgi:2-dehydro-3-deoxyphosphogluconate aldolase/(4S)-4-hydroxy-2-oxoglutarate aldolase
MKELLKEIYHIGIVPVIVLDDAQNAAAAAKALIDGGLPCAEITFRTAAAEEGIKIISKKFPQMLLGAGTVLTVEQADKAAAAGARFIVSPGLNPKVVKHCLDKKIPVIPGCANPGDIEAALEFGLDTVKFFPAEAAGGINMLKALSAPYPDIKFVPTGGIDVKNLNSYLNLSKIIACGGSWMATRDLINKGKFDEITRLTKEAVSVMLGYETEHLGINCGDEKEAEAITDIFVKFFGVEKINLEKAFFAGTLAEVLKFNFLGARGHLAILSNNAERAMYHMRLNGAVFDEKTENRDPKTGALLTVYLKEEIGGFAVHLKQRKRK